MGVLYVTQITCGDKTKRTFADGQGVGVATVLRDPIVDAHPELRLYGTHSKRLVVRGSGFSPDGTSLTLEPTRAAKYSVIEATEWSVTLELKSDGSWCDELKDDKGVELKVTKVDSGAGEVIFDKPIIVATVVKEPDGDICDDSCEWALDGVCDDGTQPNIVDDEYGWDDDWGGRYGDDHYYAGFMMITTVHNLMMKVPCQRARMVPIVPIVNLTRRRDEERGRTGRMRQQRIRARQVLRRPAPGRRVRFRYRLPGLRAGLQGQLQHLRGRQLVRGGMMTMTWVVSCTGTTTTSRTATMKGGILRTGMMMKKKASTVGYVKSADPFAVEPDEDTGAAATLLVTALLVTGALLGCCAVVRVARGDRCVVRKGNEKADLAQAWSEMTERQDKRKADVPITPDVTFSGAMA